LEPEENNSYLIQWHLTDKVSLPGVFKEIKISSGCFANGTGLYLPVIKIPWGDDCGRPYHTIKLTVIDDDGGIGIDITRVVVRNVAPTVDAGLSQNVNKGDTVQFKGTFTDPGWLDTHTFHWDFGDGSISTGTLTPKHVYTTTGVYKVTLTVTDDNGGVGQDTIVVVVRDTIGLTITLINTVTYLDIHPGFKISLLAKLTGSLLSQYGGKDNAAANKLNAFSNSASAQSGKKLTVSTADSLIGSANVIIVQLRQ
jgi:PKD repeat protein